MKINHKKHLQERYDEYLEKHQETGLKPYPDKLLALLLLQEKENYEPLMVCEGEFYEHYQEEIDNKINKVIADFGITKEDIIHFIEQKGIYYREEKFEHDKLWFVFNEGFGAMHWTIMYHKEYSPEKAYYEYYNCFHGCSLNKPLKIKRRRLKK